MFQIFEGIEKILESLGTILTTLFMSLFEKGEH